MTISRIPLSSMGSCTRASSTCRAPTPIKAVAITLRFWLKRGASHHPSVETMIDLSERRLYENAIPELEDMLNKALGKHPDRAPETIHVHFGLADNPEFERFGRLLFDWFRAPSLEVTVKPGEWARIQKIGFANITKFTKAQKERFEDALDRYTQREWRAARQRSRRAIPSQRYAIRKSQCRLRPFQR